MLRFRPFHLLGLLPILALAGCGGPEKFATNATATDSNATDNAVAVAGRDEPPSKLGKYGGTLTSATISDPKSFNYWVSGETSTSNIVGPLYDTLNTLNSYTLKYDAELAELPTISPDGKTWTFKLKPALKMERWPAAQCR